MVGSNRSTTFPSRSIRNFVKFHLISGVLRKSGWVRYNPLSSSGVRGWFGSNPPKPFCSFRYLYSGCVFSPFTSILEKKFKGNSKFCVAERCDLLGCSRCLVSKLITWEIKNLKSCILCFIIIKNS